VVLVLSSCYNKQKHLGRVSVANAEGIYFDLYQYEYGDPNVGIDYRIINEKGETLNGPHFLIGTTNKKRDDTKDFYAASHQDLIYLTYEDTNLVYVLYNLKTRKEPMDFTFQQKPDSMAEAILKQFKPNLRFVWRE
jgi:hypothetical protein